MNPYQNKVFLSTVLAISFTWLPLNSSDLEIARLVQNLCGFKGGFRKWMDFEKG